MKRGTLPCPASLLLALLCVSLLGGCAGSLLPRPAAAPAVFALERAGPAPAASQPRAAASAPTLIVNAPRAAPGFDTARIVYLRRSHEIESFGFNQWVDTPARMLGPLIAREIGQAGAFHAVLLAPTAAAGELRLDTELIRLQHEFTTHPSRVRLTLRAALVDTTTRHVVAWREFDASAVSASEDPYGGVVAAQETVRQVLLELAAFCATAAAGSVTTKQVP